LSHYRRSRSTFVVFLICSNQSPSSEFPDDSLANSRTRTSDLNRKLRCSFVDFRRVIVALRNDPGETRQSSSPRVREFHLIGIKGLPTRLITRRQIHSRRFRQSSIASSVIVGIYAIINDSCCCRCYNYRYVQ
jgi:hypothetical protein